MLALYQIVSLCGSISRICWHASKWPSISFLHWQCPSDGDFFFPRFVGLLIISLWVVYDVINLFNRLLIDMLTCIDITVNTTKKALREALDTTAKKYRIFSLTALKFIHHSLTLIPCHVMTKSQQLLFTTSRLPDVNPSWECSGCSSSCPFPNSLGVGAACLLPSFSSITRHFITHSHLSHILPHTIHLFYDRTLPLHPSTFMFITLQFSLSRCLRLQMQPGPTA
jgi:hypothetical protein